MTSEDWQTSSFCESAACAEVRWQISSFCDSMSCAEVGADFGLVSIRSTKDRDRVAVFTGDEWAAFIAGVKAGEFDKPLQSAEDQAPVFG